MPLRILVLCVGLLLGWGTGTGNVCAQTTAPASQTAPPDTAKRRISNDPLLKELEEYSKRKGLPARAVRKLFNFKKKNAVELARDPELINYAFSQHDYKIVRNIQIITLDPFGFSTTDSVTRPTNIFERAGNHLHIKTHKGRIRNKLLFRKGKKLEPQALIESERLLRQTDHILDASIRVNSKTTTADSVDIIVTTRDVFSIGGSFAYNATQTMSVVALRDVNFLGLGHQFRNRFWLGVNDRPQTWNYQGSYLVENIYRTYFTGEAVYLNDYILDQRGVNFNRGFYATTTKYAGGLAVNWFKRRTFINDSTQNLHFNTKDAWIARSYKLKSYDLGYENPGRLIASARITNVDHTKAPTEGYLNTTLYLGSLGYSYRKYYKDKYLFGFGRTEDVPAGNLFSVTGGYEYAPTRVRQYLGAQASFGKYNLNFGYLYGGAAYGSFIREGRFEHGAFNAEVLYFTKLYNANGWLIRNFAWARLTYGLNRDPGDFVKINNLEGLRGFRSGSLVGQNKFILNLESNLFTPLSFVGFKIAFLAFADIGWLAPTDETSPFKEIPYQGYGVGLRFRNEYLGFSTFQVLLAYYPRVPPGDSFNNLKFYENSRRYFEFRDFYYSQPQIVPYR